MAIDTNPDENTRLGQVLDEALNGNKAPEPPEVELDPEENLQASQETETEEKPRITSIASPAARERAEQRRADREAGRKAAQSAFAKQLKEMGFESLEEVQKVRASQRPATNTSGETASLRTEIQTLQSQVRGFKSRITQLEKENSALKDELQIRAWAYEADVDPEYIDSAAGSLQKHFQRLDSKSAKEFDAVKWFSEDLKKRKPAIFRQALQKSQEPVIHEAPANSSPPGSAPKAATATQVREGTEEATKTAMQMDAKEYREALRKKGIRHPASHV